jgi:hypothetical protein
VRKGPADARAHNRKVGRTARVRPWPNREDLLADRLVGEANAAQTAGGPTGFTRLASDTWTHRRLHAMTPARSWRA